jgi:hypothetical protein
MTNLFKIKAVILLAAIFLLSSCSLPIFKIPNTKVIYKDLFTQSGLLEMSIKSKGFGKNVDINESTIIASYNKGAYIFQKGGLSWYQEKNIILDDSIQTYDVAISENCAIISFLDKTNAKESIAIYKKNGTDWEIDTSLIRPIGNQYHGFGRSIDVCDNDIIVSTENGVTLIYSLLTSGWETAEEFYTDTLESDIYGSNSRNSHVKIINDKAFIYMLNQISILEKSGKNWESKKNLVTNSEESFYGEGASLGCNDNRFIWTPEFTMDVSSKDIFIYHLSDIGWEKDTTLSLRTNFGYETDIAMTDSHIVSCIRTSWIDDCTDICFLTHNNNVWSETERLRLPLDFGKEISASNEFSVFSGNSSIYVYNMKKLGQ